MTKVEGKAVAAASKALEDYRIHGARLSRKETVRRLAPTISRLIGSGMSYVTVARILVDNGIDIRATTLRGYHQAAVRQAKQGE